ncbi:DEHA2G00264p [Debaryomyces hansenii CBS767]|uniref:DEHA2G00264p n=1 Tax=Debaryomyces hansenii (strain ATCC 36239 / CBS 767 / BCRC 21394 / JCM 1990 / NBRC 0083 / IGC 2968) TaxID=284592 RepID=Q6BJS9_DEBHA|nr:DEHA2G00264p [Debaryomyces hansenii CBS767]CAG89983.2 DEHA2G00264p [Debaryomyces hansenii CBS767]|eukprot:XP_461542.2 DEHA2G00264p [Debaryomyces hansenii CBS767]
MYMRNSLQEIINTHSTIYDIELFGSKVNSLLREYYEGLAVTIHLAASRFHHMDKVWHSRLRWKLVDF